MKNITLFLAFFTLVYPVFGQADDAYQNLAVKKYYAVSLFAITGTGKDTYEVNDRVVDKATYDKYHAEVDNLGNCCPCILRAYDENDVLLSEYVACTDCKVGDYRDFYPDGSTKSTGHYKENHTGNWKNIWRRGYCNIKDGEFVYFNEKGEVLYSEFWKNGKQVTQASKPK